MATGAGEQTSFASWLGPKLTDKDGALVDTNTELAGTDYIGVYFSAHWCPPCRGFTPRFSAWYKENVKSLKPVQFKAIFASSDRDEGSFKEYFHSMAWDHALPFGGVDKTRLAGQYKITGIPSLLIFTADGKLITRDGVKKVVEDMTAAEFPWWPKKPSDILHSIQQLQDRDGGMFPFQDTTKAVDYLGLYFTSTNCPPCTKFVPRLTQWYNDHHNKAGFPSFDLITVANDNAASTVAKAPWKAIDIADKKSVYELNELYNVEGTPTLVVINAKTGEVVNPDVVNRIISDPEGFPYGPKPVSKLKYIAPSINDTGTVLLFTDKLTDAAAETAVVEAFTTVAKENWDEANNKPKNADLQFGIGAEDDEQVPAIRRFLGALRDEDGDTSVRIEFIDISSQRKAHMEIAKGKLPTVDEIRTFVEDAVAGKIGGGLK